MRPSPPKTRIRAFFERRWINSMGLFVLTAMSAVITLICALTGFARTNIVALVTLLLVLLCFVQVFKLRKSFRTLPNGQRIRRRATRPRRKRDDVPTT